MSQTRDQKRFTISEVAADWHELMIPQCTMRPSITRVSQPLDPWFAASRHTTAPISRERERERDREYTVTVSELLYVVDAKLSHVRLKLVH